MHLLTEFGPTLVFFTAAQLYTFKTATEFLILSTFISLVASLFYEGRIPLLPLLTALLVIGSGSITVFYDAPDAVILADSIYYFGIAAAIGFGLHRGFIFLKILFESTFAMQDKGWRILSYQWLVVLTAAGLGNEYVRIFMTPEFWVNYRTIKIGIMFLFAFYQFFLARKYRIPEASNHWGVRVTKEEKSHLVE